jgi:hypothetical protein
LEAPDLAAARMSELARGAIEEADVAKGDAHENENGPGKRFELGVARG